MVAVGGILCVLLAATAWAGEWRQFHGLSAGRFYGRLWHSRSTTPEVQHTTAPGTIQTPQWLALATGRPGPVSTAPRSQLVSMFISSAVRVCYYST
jgi:hypothetical protein